MKFYVVLTAIFCSAVTCVAGEERILSTSPNKQIVIVEKRSDGGEIDYYFIERSSRKKLGFVLPQEQRHQISNVAVVASWNKSSANVALVVFYGTKLSELLLFRRTGDGLFHDVPLNEPDPIALYNEKTGKTLPQPGDGGSENAVGPWLDDHTVALITGEAKQTEQLDQYLHLFVTFHARITNTRAQLSHIELVGPLSNAKSERFLKRWGEQYVEAHE